MISLSKHIEILLLEHDCVIIPGLGGFIANQESARMDDNDIHNFLPPYRTIRFNPELTVNDGLLVQSYMLAYDAAYPEAYLQMEKDINEMILQLDTTGSYSFNGIGTLTKNMDASLSFTAMESGILTPKLYGLYSIEIMTLEEAKKAKEILKALSQTSVLPIQTETDIKEQEKKIEDIDNGDKNIDSKESDDKKKGNKKSNIKEYATKIVKFRPNWKEVSVASAVAVIMFFLFHFPSLKSEEELNDTVVASSIFVGNPSDLGTASPTTKHAKTITSKPASYKPTIPTLCNSKKNVASNTEKATANATQKSVKTETNNTNNKEYTIVLASCVSEKNAKIFIENYEKEGFKEARFVEGTKNRVLYSGYSSNEEATEALTTLRNQSTLFKDAWILHEKK